MPRFAANLTMLFNEVPFMERFAAAARNGFAGVEYLFPYPFPAAELAAALKEHRLTQVLHNLPAGDWAGGERGIAVLPDRKAEFREGVAEAIAYAQALDCKLVNCLAGIAPAAVDAAEARATFVENIGYAAGELKKAGIRLVIEAINTRDIPGFFLTNTRQAAEIIAETGSDNVGLQYDIYHMQIMEGDLARTIEKYLPQIWHVQLADNPGRNEPGTGEIAYPFLYRWLDQLGYGGWIGCEYKPKGETEAGLGWLKAAGAAR
ncbi:hydroxypyruvate isomerase [Labrys okinawensis]|uniref:Hydroxypyruvate isomerase n=1 Tax=Labrys okinawensis TaxID=346911 RepID=A0A2S9QGH4_9HYPH|nr:hydroxypyruvate isomerase [Labrys okinawensis]PRH88457.1 hydroxypyruvate isomerase [Labrys okinawensis]